MIRFDRAGFLAGGRLRGFLTDAMGYFGASAVALCVDYGALIGLHRGAGLHYLLAATLSFTAGLAVAWRLSAVLVFRGRRRLSRRREIVGFVLSGLAGLVLTQVALAALVGGFGLTAELAKIPVAGGVFAFNFLSRRTLFAAAARA